MRLREMQALLVSLIDPLGPRATTASLSGNINGVQIGNLAAYRRAVESAAQIPPLRDAANSLLKTKALTEFREEILFPQSEGQQVLSAMQGFHVLAVNLLTALKSIASPDTETTIAVELPATSILSELATTIAEVDDFFSTLTGLPIGDGDERIQPIELTGFDLGSTWVTLSAITIPVLSMIGSIVRYAQVLVAQQRIMDAQIQMLEAAAEDRIQAVIYKGEALVSKRVKIVASLKAPAAAKSAFPPPELPKRSDLDLLLPGAAGGLEKLLTSGDPAD